MSRTLASSAMETRFSGLTPGFWQVIVTADGRWAAPELVVLREEERGEVLVTFHERSEITGSFARPGDEPPPSSLSLRLTSAGQGPEAAGAFEIECPTANDRFTCGAPAGAWDLRVRLPNHASEHLWDVRLEPGGSRNLGEISFRPGGSVVGWVRGCGGEIASPCMISLVPGIEGDGSSWQARRVEALRLEVEVDPRGFFELKGLAAGTYSLTAESGDKTALRRLSSIPVHEGMETEIAEALVLERLLELELAIEPGRDPLGRPWRFELQELGLSLTPVRMVAEGLISRERWKHAGIAAGRYRLIVHDGDDSRWLWEDLTVSASSRSFSFRIPLVEVEGTVWLGEEPLAARLWFGGERGARQIRTSSDQEGAFRVTLPEAGDWRVTLLADDPEVRRTLSTGVPEPEGEEAVELRLELPDTVISGVVLDALGRPVEGASIALFDLPRAELPAFLLSGEKGRFSTRGLGPGEIRLYAEKGGSESEEAVVTVSKSSPQLEVTLTLRDTRTLQGIVQSSTGTLAGAQVVTLSTDTFRGASSVTGTDGAFTARITPSTPGVNVMVMPPGRTFTTMQIPADRERVVVWVNDVGGEILLPGGLEALRATPAGEAIVFYAGGVAVDLSILHQWWQTQRALGARVESDDGVILPQMAAGEYALCLLQRGTLPSTLARGGARCISEFLQPGGATTLDSARLTQ